MAKARNRSATAIPASCMDLAILIENAIDFAASEVRILAQWTPDQVTMIIEDDGPGFSPDVIGRVGDPYVTTKKDRRAKSEEGSGLGLGLFIAKTLLERSGATVTAENLQPPETGAVITITWDRAAFESRRKRIPWRRRGCGQTQCRAGAACLNRCIASFMFRKTGKFRYSPGLSCVVLEMVQLRR